MRESIASLLRSGTKDGERLTADSSTAACALAARGKDNSARVFAQNDNENQQQEESFAALWMTAEKAEREEGQQRVLRLLHAPSRCEGKTTARVPPLRMTTEA